MIKYKPISAGAKALRENLSKRNIRLLDTTIEKLLKTGTSIDGSKNFTINWGCSSFKHQHLVSNYVYNVPTAVAAAINKVTALSLLHNAGVPSVECTTNKTDALAWLKDEEDSCELVMGRTRTSGTRGDGILLLDKDNWILAHKKVGESGNPFKFYTKYFKKTAEYRVHVFLDKVILVQHKKRSKAAEKVDYRIRNHERGWVYCVNDLDYPNEILGVAVDAVAALGLDFGAVDVIFNKVLGTKVLEVNTAPGLQGETTVEAYTAAIESLMK